MIRRAFLLLLVSSVAALAGDGLPPPAPRPVVYVYSSADCPACVKFWRWHNEHGADSRWRFRRIDTPDWVQQVPAFHFRLRSGWHVVYGWRDVEAFAAEYDRAQGGK